MPKAQPDVTLHIPQAQFQAVQTRLTDYLLQSQYAFVQSFAGGLETTFDIFVETPSAATHESIQLALCLAAHDTSVSVAVTQDGTTDTASQSVPIAAWMEQLVAVCTAHEGARP